MAKNKLDKFGKNFDAAINGAALKTEAKEEKFERPVSVRTSKTGPKPKYPGKKKTKALYYPAEWDEIIAETGESVNGFMVDAIYEKMKREGLI